VDALLMETGSGFDAEALAKHMAGGASFKSQPVAKRLNLLVEKLNQMNYHARWEAGPQGPRILFGHCPYASIIGKHPELCRMDAALLKELYGDDMEQIAKIEDLQGMCIFITR
jgi:predicted ArsR family transcriptional regulator